MNFSTENLPDWKAYPPGTIREVLKKQRNGGHYSEVHTDYPQNRFSGKLSEIINYLQDIRDQGFTDMQTSLDTTYSEYGHEPRAVGQTLYYRDRPETDKEWVDRVNRQVETQTAKDEKFAARRAARAKLTPKEVEAIRELGI